MQREIEIWEDVYSTGGISVALSVSYNFDRWLTHARSGGVHLQKDRRPAYRADCVSHKLVITRWRFHQEISI